MKNVNGRHCSYLHLYTFQINTKDASLHKCLDKIMDIHFQSLVCPATTVNMKVVLSSVGTVNDKLSYVSSAIKESKVGTISMLCIKESKVGTICVLCIKESKVGTIYMLCLKELKVGTICVG